MNGVNALFIVITHQVPYRACDSVTLCNLALYSRWEPAAVVYPPYFIYIISIDVCVAVSVSNK